MFGLIFEELFPGREVSQETGSLVFHPCVVKIPPLSMCVTLFTLHFSSYFTVNTSLQLYWWLYKIVVDCINLCWCFGVIFLLLQLVLFHLIEYNAILVCPCHNYCHHFFLICEFILIIDCLVLSIREIIRLYSPPCLLAVLHRMAVDCSPVYSTILHRTMCGRASYWFDSVECIL